jgi:CheY-like chemotaxis protein
MLFVVSPDRPDLYNYLTWHFSGEKDVEVILDRRETDPAQAREWSADEDVLGLSGVIARYVKGEEPAAADRTPASTSEERGAPAQTRKAFRSETILVVDDEPMVARLVAQMLSLDGYEVETASNGVVALNRLQEREYDLILCDLRMPEMDGESLYREATRQKPELGRRFIFLTGSAAISETRHFLEHSGPPHLTKPFDLETFRRVIQRTLAAVISNPPRAQDPIAGGVKQLDNSSLAR